MEKVEDVEMRLASEDNYDIRQAIRGRGVLSQ